MGSRGDEIRGDGGVCIERCIPHVLCPSVQLPLPQHLLSFPCLSVPSPPHLFSHPPAPGLCRMQTEAAFGFEVSIPNHRIANKSKQSHRRGIASHRINYRVASRTLTERSASTILLTCMSLDLRSSGCLSWDLRIYSVQNDV